MIRVVALTSGKFVPSARFRVRQNIASLAQLGVEVREYAPFVSKYGMFPGWPKNWNPLYAFPLYVAWQGVKLATRAPGILASWDSQVVWLERQLLPGSFTLEGFLKKPIAFDVDDAIWLNPPFKEGAARAIARQAEVVIAGNAYLANWFSTYNRQVYIVPTAIDTERFRPDTHMRSKDRFILGWTGLAPNLPYLYLIEKPLTSLMKEFPEIELWVIADQAPDFKHIPSDRVRYIPWSLEIEVKVLQQIDVGLMPLADTPWARGKCSFKMLQYMACELPVVVSPVGMNAEILNMEQVGLGASKDTEWYDAIRHFYFNREQGQSFGNKGRLIVEQKFNCKVIACQLAEVFKKIVNP